MGHRPSALGQLGAGCCETPWFCQSQTELCSDHQSSLNKCSQPKIASAMSGCDWHGHWHRHRCQTLSCVELGLILPPLNSEFSGSSPVDAPVPEHGDLAVNSRVRNRICKRVGVVVSLQKLLWTKKQKGQKCLHWKTWRELSGTLCTALACW